MRLPIDPIVQGVPIVNPDGSPTPQFILLWQQLFGNEEATAEAVEGINLDGKADKTTGIIAGDELTGGGALDGDVTIDHDESGVTPGTYGDASNIPVIEVNEFGHITDISEVAAAGGGGTPWWWAPPDPAGFSMISGDATNPTFTTDADIGTVLDFNSNAVSGEIVRAAVETITSPASAWTYEVRMAGNIFTATSCGVGLLVRNAANNRNVLIDLRQNGSIQIERRSMTAFSAAPTVVLAATSLITTTNVFSNMFWKVTYDGSTSLRIYFSSDGKYWTLVHTENKATYLIANPDLIGFFIHTNNGGSAEDLNLSVSRRVKSW